MSEESRSFREEIDKWSKTSAVDFFALIGLGGFVTAVVDKVINHGKTLTRPDDGLSEWERSFRKGMGVAFVAAAEVALLTYVLKWIFSVKKQDELGVEGEVSALTDARPKTATVQAGSIHYRDDWRSKALQETQDGKAMPIAPGSGRD